MKKEVRMHIKLWLEHDGKMLLGIGLAELLWCIGELGSLKKAAENFSMSYRAAWGRIKRAEEAFGFPLVESQGAKRDGYSLTHEGRKVVGDFLDWHKDVQNYAREKAKSLPLELSR